MLLTVHDSVVFEIAEGYEQKWIPIIREVMENISVFNKSFGDVPFPVDIKEFGMAA
jgi:DNA polymerase I-like protein with 3'-5' exonuclease and polymerase domains